MSVTSISSGFILFIKSRDYKVLIPAILVPTALVLISPTYIQEVPLRQGISLYLLPITAISGSLFLPLFFTPPGNLESLQSKFLRLSRLAILLIILLLYAVFIYIVLLLRILFDSNYNYVCHLTISIIAVKNSMLFISIGLITGRFLGVSYCTIPGIIYLGTVLIFGTTDSLSTPVFWNLLLQPINDFSSWFIAIAAMLLSTYLYTRYDLRS